MITISLLIVGLLTSVGVFLLLMAALIFPGDDEHSETHEHEEEENE